MLESFHLQRSEALINACWQEKNALTEQWLGCAPSRLLRPEVIGDRSRLDVQWNGQTVGVFGPGGAFQRLDFPDTVTPGIARMLQEFLDSACPLPFASLRFRSGCRGEAGLWIDTSNGNIKNVLEDGTWLRALLAKGWVIEAGQKHKAVALNADKPGGVGLEPAPLHAWLASYDVNNDEIPLCSHVSLFSQPGPEVNRALIAAGFELLDQDNVRDVAWAEWGAGYGNLTAAYASFLGQRAWASELEPAAAACLAMNAAEFFAGVATAESDVLRALPEQPPLGTRLWILDPPRSGFGPLLAKLKGSTHAPARVLIYHCHRDGLAKDTDLLKEAGYRLRAWSSVDAFPATTHHEVISLWGKD